MTTTSRMVQALLGGGLILLIVSLPGIEFVPTDPPPASRSEHSPRAPQAHSAVQVRVQEAYGKLPLSFEANQGQTDPQVKYLSRGNGYTLFLTPTEAVLLLKKAEARTDRSIPPLLKAEDSRTTLATILRMKLIDANSAPLVAGLDELPGRSNYFIGKDPAKWRTDVPTHAKVQYHAIYPGIDLVFYGNQGQLEYDFIVRPGADPRSIVLGFEGADRLEVDAQGDLLLRTAGGAVLLRKPVIYQETNGKRRPILGGYELQGKHRVGFRVTAYDRSKPLVIDPVLAYSTYLGGSNTDVGLGIAVDSSGNAYVTGYTTSPNFPTTPSSLLPNTPGAICIDPPYTYPCVHAFVTKLDATGSKLVYSTYLGGSGDDWGMGIAVDSSGNAYVTGFTDSTNFPTTAGAFQTAFGGGYWDAFVTKLNAAGSGLVYSTYLGGSDIDEGRHIAVDSSGNAYVTGDTGSINFPTTVGAFQTAYGGGPYDAFVTKLTADGGLVYSTYLGGSHTDRGFGMALDSSGNAYVTGSTMSLNFPTANPFQASCSPSPDGNYCHSEYAFVTKLDTTGSKLFYSTYLGDGGEGSGIAVDSYGNAYVTGYTGLTNFPTTAGAFQTAFGGGGDAFVTKLDAAGNGLVYSTYLGGSGGDQGFRIAVDSSGNAYVAGVTASTNFPTANAIQRHYGGGTEDAFVTKLNVAGSALVYSTYLGGSADDAGFGIAVDSSGNAYVTGFTASTNFPTANPLQATNAGSPHDAFVAKINPATSTTPPPGKKR